MTTPFEITLKKCYPKAQIIDNVYGKLQTTLFSQFGFGKDNTLACCGVCRDEITNDAQLKLESMYYDSFKFASLAGLPLAGRTAFSAYVFHCPKDKMGNQKLMIVGLTHIGINKDGEVGTCQRRGLDTKSGCCGALCAAFAEASLGKFVVGPVPDEGDLEYYMMKKKLSQEIPKLNDPVLQKSVSLLELTKGCENIIDKDITNLINNVVPFENFEVSVLVGTQIHGPNFSTYISPSQCYVLQKTTKKRFEINLG